MNRFSFRATTRTFLSLVILAGALSGLAADTAGAGTGGGAKSVDDAWARGMKAGDVNAVVACYAPDAVMWLPGSGMVKGGQEIRKAYEEFLGANTIKDVVMSDTNYKTAGNLSAAWGRFSLTTVPKAGGAPVVMAGRFTEIAEKRAGKWVYVADHASGDPAPAPAAPAKPAAGKPAAPKH